MDHLVDYLSARADMVIRFQGGDNAGHTVVNEYGRFARHLTPCGVFYPYVRCLLGLGRTVNLYILAEEQDRLHAAGVDTGNLWIDMCDHLIWPHHRLIGASIPLRAVDQVLGVVRAYWSVRRSALCRLARSARRWW